MTAAISPAWSSRMLRVASRSLYGAMRVSSWTPARDPRGVGQRRRVVDGPARIGRQCRVVVMAVVGPLELQHPGAIGERAGEPHGVVGGLGAGAHESDARGARYQRGDAPGEEDRLVVEHGEEMGAARRLLGDRPDDRLVRVPEDQRPRAQAVVDVLVAARVPEACALAVAEHERDVVGQPRRPHDPARQQGLGFGQVVSLHVGEPPVASDGRRTCRLGCSRHVAPLTYAGVPVGIARRMKGPSGRRSRQCSARPRVSADSSNPSTQNRSGGPAGAASSTI